MQETVEGKLFYSTNNNNSINQVTKKTGENIALKTVNPVAFKPIYIVVIVAGIVAITTISITIPIAIKNRGYKKKPIIIFMSSIKLFCVAYFIKSTLFLFDSFILKTPYI